MSEQAGRLVARAVAREGVDTVFTLSGGHVMPVYEGCRLEAVRVIDVRHEQAAAHAAEAWGRINRACGVALVTAGPGVTGTVTAVVNCFAAQTPLVVLGGARPVAQAEQGALQEFDQLSLFKPITKWAASCSQPDRVADHVATAFRQALAPPRGPAYLELPMDVLFSEADGEPGPSRSSARSFGDPREVMKAADLLTNAERPAVIAGSAIWWDGAWKQLALLAENGRLPVYLNGSGRGALPPDHELFFQHSRGEALEAADVVCVIGTPLDFRLRFGRFGDARLVHVHADARELGRNRAPDAGIVGDAAAVLGILADGVKNRRPTDAWLERLRDAEARWWDEHRAELQSDAAPIHHYRLGKVLDEVLDPGTIVIGDGGDVVAAVSRVLRVHKPGHWLDPGPFGCLGVGPPYALGVKAAKPDKQVVVVAGDGAFGLNGFELDTLVRFGLDAVFVVGNDAGWGEIRIPQKGIYGDDAGVAVDLAPTRYDRLTEALGGHGEHVERPEELAPALERALGSGQPAVVNVMLDPTAMAGHAYRGM
ncbi:MAG TPA: thiamine pyrophosphate-dependent enzyme [Gaiellaceae bacterium]|jgi:acetolactate synthase-1/2/3 large subunit